MEYLKERRRVPSKLRDDAAWRERSRKREQRGRWMEVVIVSWTWGSYAEMHCYFMSRRMRERVSNFGDGCFGEQEKYGGVKES